jgi:hypothetical protein
MHDTQYDHIIRMKCSMLLGITTTPTRPILLSRPNPPTPELEAHKIFCSLPASLRGIHRKLLCDDIRCAVVLMN